MSDEKNDAVIAVKGRFRAPGQGYYGQFFYLINPGAGYVEDASIIITSGADLYEAVNPMESWKRHEALIQKLRYENRYLQALTNEFQAKLKQLGSDKQYFGDLLKAIAQGKAETLNFVLSSFYRRAIKDDQFFLEGHVENAAIMASEAPAVAEPVVVRAADGVYLPVKLDLDPIAGKDVKQLRVGDTILVRVMPESDRANAFIDAAGLRSEEGFIRSAPFTVTSVTYPGVGLELVGKLKEGIYGKIVEEQNVLVRVPETGKAPSAGVRVPLAASIPNEKKQLMIIGVGLIGSAMLGILLYWVISSL